MTSATACCSCGSELTRIDRSTRAELSTLASQLGRHLRKDIGLEGFEPPRGHASDWLPFEPFRAFW